MPVVFAVCLAALCASCGQNVVQFPFDGAAPTVATEEGTVVAGTVPAANYEIDFETFSLITNTQNVVQSQSGYAQLVPGSVAGQDYAIHLGALSVASTLPEVDAAYNSAKAAGLLAELTTLQLPAAAFDLEEERLDTPVERTVIIRNTDQSVSSYQLLVISFY
jgi:hypothetical protein